MFKINSSVNTFFEIFEKEQAKNTKDEPFAIGKIICIDPLIIQVGELPLYEKNLRINPYLLEWIETINITTSTNEGHSHSIGTIVHQSKLVIDSYVACYGIEYSESSRCYQKYCVLEVLE